MKKFMFIALIVMIALSAFSVCAQTNAFTYQGLLSSTGTPANGSHDFEFALFDAVSSGTQLGSTIARSGIAVSNGVFAVTLDFGDQFPGANRFLEIRVRPSGGGAFSTLSPRQPLNSTPYAVKSVSADVAGSAGSAGTFTGNLAGDVTGTQVSTTVARLRGRNVAAIQPNNGQVLKFNTTNNQWEPANDETAAGGGGGTITGVTAGTGLTGGGTTGSVTVAIANGGVGTMQLADGSVTDAKIVGISGSKVSGAVATATNATTATTATSFTGPLSGEVTGTQAATSISPGAVTTAKIADSTVTAAKIAPNQVVKSVNSLRDDVTLAAGSNITITPSGNTLTIASTAGGGCPSPCTAAIFNATQQYNFNGNRVLTAPGSNTILGVTAGTNNTGRLNSFFGAGSGEANTSGSGNSFFGGGSGQESVTGSDNSFFGGNTGRGNSSGSRNSFFGRLAGRFNTLGNDNTFVGYQAGTNNGAGVSNTFVGAGSGESNSGSQNAFFGSNAGAANSTGQQNSFFGEGAGSGNTTAGSNSFFGRFSGVVNSTGNSNSFFGIFSGDSNTSGDRNVFIGANAGEANTTGNNNTIIGADANVGSVNLTNATAIGRLATVNTSNSLVLGSVSPATNVGIGTTSPTHRLTIGVPETPVIGGADTAVYSAGSAYSIVRDTTNNVEALMGAEAGRVIFGAMTNHELVLRTNNAARLRIFTDGNVNIGGGTGDPQVTLGVNGKISLNSFGTGGSAALCWNNTTDLISGCSSSIRYKKNIANFTPGLDLIKRLRPVSFAWKHDNAADLGVVAEEVAEIEPLLITRRHDGEIEGVKYDRIGVVLVNAVKEQQAQIESQQKLIDDLKTQLSLLKAAMCAENKRATVCHGQPR